MERGKRITILYIAFCLFSFVSCEYRPDGEFERALIPPSDSLGISINLHNLPDTILIYRSTRLYYYLDSVLLPVELVTFTLDGEKILESDSAAGSFIVDPVVSGPDTCLLKATAYLGTATGSIADMNGKEKYVVANSWILILSDTLSAAVKINKVEPLEGRLMISWDRFEGIDFYGYVLYKTVVLDDGTYCFAWRVFSERESLSYIDSSFTGGDAIFSVDVITGYEEYLVGPEYPASFAQPQLYYESDSQLNLHFTWTRSIFYENMEGYVLDDLLKNEELFRSSNDSVFTLEAGILFSGSFRLRWVPANPGIFGGLTASVILSQVQVGEAFPFFDLIGHGSDNVPFLFIVDGYSINKVSLEGGLIYTQSMLKQPADMGVANDGTVVFGVDRNYVKMFSGSDLSLLGQQNVKNWDMMVQGLPDRISISDSLDVATTTNSHLFVYDFQKWGIDISQSGLNLSAAEISPSGNFLAAYDGVNGNVQLYDISSQSLQSLGTLQAGISSYLFRKTHSGEEIITLEAGFLVGYRCSDFTVSFSIPTPMINIIDLDPLTGNLLGSSSDTLYIYDLLIGEQVKKFYSANPAGRKHMALFRNVLYVPGFRLPMD